MVTSDSKNKELCINLLGRVGYRPSHPRGPGQAWVPGTQAWAQIRTQPLPSWVGLDKCQVSYPDLSFLI